MAELIRTFDWSRTPLGPIESWMERCRNITDMVLASGFPTIVLVGRDLIQIYNDGFRELMGNKHPAGLGQATKECWPEVWHLNAPIYQRVFAGETVTLEDASRPVNRDGATKDAWFTLSYSPVRGGDGTVADILVTVIETTDRVRAQNALRDSEERFRAFVTASSDAVYRMSPDWTEMRQLDGQGFLMDTTEPSRAWMDRYIHPDDRPVVQDAIARAVRGKTMFELKHQVRQADGSLGWTLSRAVPILDEAGEIAEWLGAAKDVTEAKQADDLLHESEERFRSFAENSADTLWIFDADRRALEYVSPAFTEIYGEAPDRIMADLSHFVELVHPDDRDEVAGAMPQLLSGDAHQVEYRIVRPSDGAVRWIQDTGFPIRDASGRIARAGGIAQDVTERREAEDTLRVSEAQLQVMVAELHHRTRNLIGVVGTLMRQIIASSSSLADFRDRFTERLEALSRVQSLLAQYGNEKANIGDVVRMELDAFGADLDSERVRIEGEAVPLRKSTVQTLALAIHELATNARKYGALQADDGWLVVRWEAYVAEPGRRRLRLDWTESGIDPAVEETEGPLHKGGYGRKLIEEALP
ncbi:PAS domain-containing sensor histidine kinase [Aureimonas leprariae]|uniref:Blue-light-activated histidine kinase n=1 Tax=Plantimonas leprariae TaxID=2615207 RepID=A0A7V7TX52_9HYPH|nr:PAS domain S-box protein [Aureimonas leprariae]KAB0680911.1 PAS domain S-box protein [Aureimonas leprariae]